MKYFSSIYFATTNLGKVNSVLQVLSQYGIEVVHEPLELSEPRSDDLRTIARHKVLEAYHELKKPVLAQDAGFFIDALNGFPKAFTNFALETIGIEGILTLLQGRDRSCAFHNCIAYYEKGLPEPIYFESETRGHLAETPRGEVPGYAWSSLWLLFIPEGSQKTLGEMSFEEYEDWRRELNKTSFATQFAKWYASTHRQKKGKTHA